VSGGDALMPNSETVRDCARRLAAEAEVMANATFPRRVEALEMILRRHLTPAPETAGGGEHASTEGAGGERRFRKKPVVIEAVQFLANGEATKPVRGMTLWRDDPEGVTPRDMSWGYVTTIHGQRAHVQHGDWILPEPDGIHFYPVRPDIFAATYEAADSPSERPAEETVDRRTTQRRQGERRKEKDELAMYKRWELEPDDSWRLLGSDRRIATEDRRATLEEK